MLLMLVALALGLPILWTVSVGAVRDVRRLRQDGSGDGCRAWVTVPGMRGRLYRCCEPVDAGGSWCRRHEVARARAPTHLDPDAALVDECQAVGRALVQARIGIPLAILTLIGIAVLVAWAVQRTV